MCKVCSVKGIGIDLCSVERMENLLRDSRFLEKHFTESERQYILSKNKAAPESMAGIWAAKEAVAKALGCGIAFSMEDVEITHTPLGQPVASLRGKALEKYPEASFQISITHEGGMAAAAAIFIAL